jgi:hypothetical protein
VTRVLIAGLPRSGTSWVGAALGSAADTSYVREPDNVSAFPYAVKAQRAVGGYPVLAPGDAVPDVYRRLWAGALGTTGRQEPMTGRVARRLYRNALAGSSVYTWNEWPLTRRAQLRTSIALARPCGDPPTGHVVVKTIYALFALRWICAEWNPKLVIVLRSPLNMVASFLALGWGPPLDSELPFRESESAAMRAWETLLPSHTLTAQPGKALGLRRLTWQLAAMRAVLQQLAASHPDAIVLHHEEICQDPYASFAAVSHTLGLPSGDAVGDYLHASNRAGSGPFDTSRVTSQQPEAWRDRLTAEQVREVRETMSLFEAADPRGSTNS